MIGDLNHTGTLLKALEESGWFTASEHNDLVSLLKERKSAQSTLANGGEKSLSVQGANFFLEGGILAQDANTFLDEKGVKYFGEGGSRPYQQDRVTLYLRILSAQSGKILKTIYRSKTLFTQPNGANSYQFVRFKKPYEAETGTITTLPGQFIITETIKQAVQGLVIEGIRDGLWSAPENSALVTSTLIQKYEQEIKDLSEDGLPDNQAKKGLFGLRPRINAPFISVHPYLGSMRYVGDYTQRETKGMYGVSLEMYINPIVGIQVNGATGTMASKDAFSVNLTSLEANVILRPFPYQRWTPILLGGAGVLSRSGSTPFELQGEKYGQAQGGIGVQYTPSSFLGLRSMVMISQPFTDSLDGKIMGSHSDYYTRFTVGIVFHLGRFLVKTQSIKFTKVTP
ncbi:hypothetical protein GCM10027299_41540 [Larkinella ripae]